MDDGINFAIDLFGSGNAFFAGTFLILFSILLACGPSRRWPTLARNLSLCSGSLLVALSAVPLPWWAYAVLTLATFIWWIREGTSTKFDRKILVGRAAIFLIWLSAAAFELPNHLAPTLPALACPTLFLIGDSISAGTTEGEQGTWPKVLAERHQVEVRDFSKMGATVKSARKQADKIGAQPGLIVLEIGGNDLLGSTTAEQFEQGLDTLLSDVCRPDRLVVMLELPLPPFANRFGMSQRRLAQKYHVLLIPRRILIDVLTTRGATVDGIHLTRKGHVQMAEAMWSVLRSAFAGK